MNVTTLDLPEVVEVCPVRREDSRGVFAEVWNAREWRNAGVDVEFVQDNMSLSRRAGTLRGLHYQLAPFAQAKLVQVFQGAIFDVAVDIRPGSPTFGKWVGRELSDRVGNQLYVPAGFAHGFMTLVPDTRVHYKVSAYYSGAHDRAISFDDSEIGIEWPLEVDRALMSAKDKDAPRLKDAEIEP